MSEDSAQSEVSLAILKALEIAVKSELLAVNLPNEVILERPKNRDHGDYATSIALTLARESKLQPKLVAQIIIDSLISNDLLSSCGIVS